MPLNIALKPTTARTSTHRRQLIAELERPSGKKVLLQEEDAA